MSYQKASVVAVAQRDQASVVVNDLVGDSGSVSHKLKWLVGAVLVAIVAIVNGMIDPGAAGGGMTAHMVKKAIMEKKGLTMAEDGKLNLFDDQSTLNRASLS
jgi:hypothetical protein